jgi:hypothetical protein
MPRKACISVSLPGLVRYVFLPYNEHLPAAISGRRASKQLAGFNGHVCGLITVKHGLQPVTYPRCMICQCVALRTTGSSCPGNDRLLCFETGSNVHLTHKAHTQKSKEAICIRIHSSTRIRSHM